MAAKDPLRFRAVASKRRSGTLLVQHSADGSIWHGSVDGLDVADVTKEFKQLLAHGKHLVDTPDYTHERA